ncbi:uncharacterized protein LOC125239293 [Leguminivora glycinivorella]|uniref:uncharacterized protein LOC125239293 n=1 Tax=Leguminivora glycinivorella TaxID=1035111 RepID=UPI00200F0676|nr:uncharacterized protein LOC125239293 [Leguminivora glycinivorella]
MSVFRNLRDACINFQEDLENDSTQLFCARIGQSYDEEISNKMQDLSLFSAKLKYLQAKSISMGPDRPHPHSEEATMAQYEETATWKGLEQKTVNSVSQFRDVRRLITTPDSRLEPEQMERKEEIIVKLKEYRDKEEKLWETEELLTKAEEEHIVLRRQWDQELGELRDMSEQAGAEEEVWDGPLKNKLQALIQKMEMMRWLISRLVTARSNYDWLRDPDRRLRALKMARETNSMEAYTGM